MWRRALERLLVLLGGLRKLAALRQAARFGEFVRRDLAGSDRILQIGDARARRRRPAQPAKIGPRIVEFRLLDLDDAELVERFRLVGHFQVLVTEQVIVHPLRAEAVMRARLDVEQVQVLVERVGYQILKR